MHADTPTPAPRRSIGRRVLAWTGRILLGLVALIAVSAGVVYGVSSNRLARLYPATAHPIPVRDDSASIVEGERLVTIRGCNDCHGANMAGRILIDDPAFGRMPTANLTSGRAGGALTPEAFELAVRHGVRPDGSALKIMPSEEYAHLGDEELAAMYAYVRSLPAVNAPLPPTRIGPVAHALYVAGQIPLTPAEKLQADGKGELAHAAAPAAAVTPEFGAYMAKSCTGCHGQKYAGGSHPGMTRPARNLTPHATGIEQWTEQDFVTAISTGRRPDGTMLDTTAMPVKMTSKMSDVEKRAIYAYLRTVEPREFMKND